MHIYCDSITVYAVIVFIAVFNCKCGIFQPYSDLSVFGWNDERQFSVHSENVRNDHNIVYELEFVLKELFPSVFEGFYVDESVDVVLNGLFKVFDLFTE